MHFNISVLIASLAVLSSSSAGVLAAPLATKPVSNYDVYGLSSSYLEEKRQTQETKKFENNLYCC